MKLKFLIVLFLLSCIAKAQPNCIDSLTLVSKKFYLIDGDGEKQQMHLKSWLQLRKDSIVLSIEDPEGKTRFIFRTIKSTTCAINATKTSGLMILDGIYKEVKEDTTYNFNANFVINIKDGLYNVQFKNMMMPNQFCVMEMIIDNKKKLPTKKEKRN
jgi:hypothetical protein